MKALASKIAQIQKECSYVQKDGRNDFHKYNYASAANVLEKVNESCAKHNVASFPRYSVFEVREHINAKGNREYLTTVQCDLKLIDGDSGEEITVTAFGCGQDPGDKGIAKAMTMALKYCWMTTLNISTGDDPEADTSVDERNANNKPTQTKQQPQKQTPKEQLIFTAQQAGYKPAEIQKLILEQFPESKGSINALNDSQIADIIAIIRAAENMQD